MAFPLASILPEVTSLWSMTSVPVPASDRSSLPRIQASATKILAEGNF